MTIGQTAGFSSTSGLLAGNAKARETENRFQALIDGISAASDSEKISEKKSSESDLSLVDHRLPGDYISSLSNKNGSPMDRIAQPFGAAANAGQNGIIDKTSKLYEQAMELESYLVKIMLSSMKNTVEKTNLSGDSDFAGNMYEDMFYDELSRTVTKSAGFGLADQVYLQLSGSR